MAYINCADPDQTAPARSSLIRVFPVCHSTKYFNKQLHKKKKIKPKKVCSKVFRILEHLPCIFIWSYTILFCLYFNLSLKSVKKILFSQALKSLLTWTDVIPSTMDPPNHAKWTLLPQLFGQVHYYQKVCLATGLSTSLGKMFLVWHFLQNENIDDVCFTVLSGTIFLFCFSALFSNIYRKINFMAKNGSNLCNFHSKREF